MKTTIKFLTVIMLFTTIFSSCKKEVGDIPMTWVKEVTVTYQIFSTDSNAAELGRKITFLSDWKMDKTSIGDTLIPIYTDTIVTGNFTHSFTMKTLKDYFPARGVCKTYSIPYALGWKYEGRIRFSHTNGEVDVNNSHRESWAGTCVGDRREISRISFTGVDDWDWDGH